MTPPYPALRAIATLLLTVVIGHNVSGAPAPEPTAKQVSTYDRQGIKLTFISDDPTFDPKERDWLVDTFYAVYPAEMALFNPQAPKQVRVSVEREFKGLAATAGDTIHLNAETFHRHPAAVNVLTHEAMHVVQQYKHGGPGWLTEGLADYARFRFSVPAPTDDWKLPEYNPRQHYDNSYRVTARFLVWCNRHIKPGIVVELDRAMREGRYSPAVWHNQTGKSVDELWAEYGRNPAL